MNLLKIVGPTYYSNIVKLAIPIITANIGQALVQLVDSIMVGHLGSTELAAASFANMIVMNVVVLGNGIAMGLTPNVGYSYVSKEYGICSKFFQNALLQNGIVGLIMVLFLLGITPLLYSFGQPVDVVDKAISFYKITAMSLLPYMVFLAFKQFMDGVGNTRIAMIITIGVNLLNVLLNYILIYGKLGFPEYGMDGAAIATFIARLLMPIIFFLYMRRAPFYRNFLKFFAIRQFSRKINTQLLAVGTPIATQLAVEFFALSLTAIMMGWISKEAMAANHIVYTTITFFFLIINGISAAVTILSSHAMGLKDKIGIQNYTISSLHLSGAFMLIAGGIIILFGEQIASIFVTERVVIDLAVQMFVVVAFMEFFDGVQVTALGVLRGMSDVSVPMIYGFVCYGVVSLTVAYVCGFTLGLGPQGIWGGFATGVTLAGVLFIRRIAISLNKIK